MVLLLQWFQRGGGGGETATFQTRCALTSLLLFDGKFALRHYQFLLSFNGQSQYSDH